MLKLLSGMNLNNLPESKLRALVDLCRNTILQIPGFRNAESDARLDVLANGGISHPAWQNCAGDHSAHYAEYDKRRAAYLANEPENLGQASMAQYEASAAKRKLHGPLKAGSIAPVKAPAAKPAPKATLPPTPAPVAPSHVPQPSQPAPDENAPWKGEPGYKEPKPNKSAPTKTAAQPPATPLLDRAAKLPTAQRQQFIKDNRKAIAKEQGELRRFRDSQRHGHNSQTTKR